MKQIVAKYYTDPTNLGLFLLQYCISNLESNILVKEAELHTTVSIKTALNS